MDTMPVEVQTPLSHMSITKSFAVPGSIPEVFRVEVLRPDGTMQIFPVCKTYTRSLNVDEKGRVTIVLGGKRFGAEIRYPSHFLFRDEVLCVVKKFDLMFMSEDDRTTFGLNYDLFSLPWKLCLVVHNGGGLRRVFFATRQEWLKGELATMNREVQMFLKMPNERHFDLDLFMSVADKEIREWCMLANDNLARKGA